MRSYLDKKNLGWALLGVTLLTGIGVAYLLYLSRPFNYRIAAYVTDLSGRSTAQVQNIRLSSAMINDKIIASQQTFSFNQSAGPYSRARGFLDERSFLHGEVIKSSGGGVCQVSSTLFNAAKIAGLDIVERVPHSQEVLSVPAGQDATLAYGVADLKLLNPYSFPIKIRTRISQEQLKIEIWGKELSHEI